MIKESIMVNKDLVSIIIPTYERKKYVHKAIYSALEQTYDKIEIIVVDNDSKDGTKEFLEDLFGGNIRVKIFKNHSNVGPVRNWMKCLEKVSGKYTKILFSDDLLESTFIEDALNLMDIDVGFVYSATKIFNDQNAEENKIYRGGFQYLSSISFLERSLLSDSEIPESPGCGLFRTSDLRENLILDVPNDDKLDFSFYGAGNDVLLFTLPCLKYSRVAHIETVGAYFREHDSSFTCSNDLSLYYAWARAYVVKKSKNKKLISLFTALIWIRSRKNLKYQNLYKSLKSEKSLFFVLQVYIKKLKIRLRVLLLNIRER